MSPRSGSPDLRTTTRLAVVALHLQAAHFGEELAAGFHRVFPAALGLPPWPLAVFAGFNLFWLGVWALAIRQLAAGSRAAEFALWLLSVGCIANGVAHPLLALRAGGYFPGLVTAPLAGLAGVLLFRDLVRLSSRPGRPAAYGSGTRA